MCCAAPFRRRPARAVMRAPVRAALARGAGFLALWAAMIGATPADTAVGLVTAAAATWVSLRLLSPGTGRVRWAFLPGLALRFFRQSVLAGIDVAKRALDPSLPLRPRFITYPVRFPPGAPRLRGADQPAARLGASRRGRRRDALPLPRRRSAGRRAVGRGGGSAAQRPGGAAAMSTFLVGAAGFILAMVALALLRILRGPGDADRLMAAQLLGRGGIAVLLLGGIGTGVAAVVDVGVTLALLAAFAAVAFVKAADASQPGSTEADEDR